MMDVFFKPRNVALIGATETEGSVGRRTLLNLTGSSFGGAVFPVNPKRQTVLGIKAFPSIAEVPAAVDLAVIVTPAASVPAVIQECGAAGVRGAIVISAGFQELGAEGERLQQELTANAKAAGIRVIGPNCLGVMSPPTGLNATFAACMGRSGNVGFISQSGALCTSVLDWSMEAQVGFSAFVSTGAMADVGWGDLIDYLGNDPHTASILIYMESVGDARSFLSAAREVALQKPIIVIKAGRTSAGSRAAASHTGALTGSDDVLDAAFRRVGVLRVDTISELFHMAEVLAKQPRPRGPRLAVLTNAGGPGVLAADALLAGGAQLAELAPETMAELDALLPPHWSRNNPVDILGDAGADRYGKAMEIVARDPNSDGLLAILTPQAMTDPTSAAESVKAHAHLRGKPVIASWMGGPAVAVGTQILTAAGIPCFGYPDTAASIFAHMYRYSQSVLGIYETPGAQPRDGSSNPSFVANLCASIREQGRTLLTEYESKQVLAAYGIPVAETRIAGSIEEAVTAAEAIGYPVVLKLHSKTITHKTDVGGVELNLGGVDAVRSAYARIQAGVGPEHFLGVTVQPMVKMHGYELILGASPDAQFGPVLLFGLGGQLVEVFKDRALGLPPLNTTLARRMIEQTTIYKALQGVRGRRPVDLGALEQLLVRFSELVAEQPVIKEIDINPLLASPDEFLALDARVVLHDPALTKLPRLAICPYPRKYASVNLARNGEEIHLRPIRPEDEPLMVRFHEVLSERTVYFRYLQFLGLSSRVAHERLTRICFIDYDREMALVAINSSGELIGVGRLRKNSAYTEGEFALVIADQYQKQGLGTAVLARLIDIARAEGLTKVNGQIHGENTQMQGLCRKLGFVLRQEAGDPDLLATMELSPS